MKKEKLEKASSTPKKKPQALVEPVKNALSRELTPGVKTAAQWIENPFQLLINLLAAFLAAFHALQVVSWMRHATGEAPMASIFTLLCIGLFFVVGSDPIQTISDTFQTILKRKKKVLLAESMGRLCILLLLSCVVYANTDGEQQTAEWMREKKEDPKEEQERCSLCLDEYEEEINTIMTRCKHQYHADCFRQMKKHRDQCPLCRAYLVKPNERKLGILLFDSIIQNNPEKMEEAIKSGANVNSLPTLSLPDTPLTFAILYDRADLVEILLKHEELHVNKLARGRTALHFAIGGRRLNILQLLLNDRRTDVNVQNSSGQSALLFIIPSITDMMQAFEMVLNHRSITAATVREVLDSGHPAVTRVLQSFEAIKLLLETRLRELEARL